MKIALVVCPLWDSLMPPAAPAILQSALKVRGHEVRFYDLNMEMRRACGGEEFAPMPGLGFSWADPGQVAARIIPRHEEYLDAYAERILGASPRLIGFSIFGSNKLLSLHLAARLKKMDPRIKIVFGGPTCFNIERCREILSRGCVDAVVFGDGDRSFPGLIDDFARTDELRPRLGVWLREDPASWRAEQDFMRDLDEVPLADFSGYDLEPYQGVRTLHSSRGCVRNCSFCSDWRLKRFRQMSGERIYREVRHQLERDPRHRTFYFADSLMNGSMRSLSDFCGRLRETSTEVLWNSFAAVRPEMTEDFLAKMHGAGCRLLLYGIETGSARLLQAMKKRVTPELNGRVLIASMRAGIKTIASMMVGFPTETEEDFQATLDFIRRYAAGIGEMTPALVSIYEMADWWSAYGLPADNHRLFWRSPDGRNDFPLRLERLKRLMAVAEECSVPFKYEGKLDSAAARRYLDLLESEYREWAGSRTAP